MLYKYSNELNGGSVEDVNISHISVANRIGFEVPRVISRNSAESIKKIGLLQPILVRTNQLTQTLK